MKSAIWILSNSSIQIQLPFPENWIKSVMSSQLASQTTNYFHLFKPLIIRLLGLRICSDPIYSSIAFSYDYDFEEDYTL